VPLSEPTSLNCVREAELSPRDPRDALYQLTCCPTVVQITQTDRVSAWLALSATATFYSSTCIVLYTHRCSRLNYRTASMRCSVSRTFNVLCETEQNTSMLPSLVLLAWCDQISKVKNLSGIFIFCQSDSIVTPPRQVREVLRPVRLYACLSACLWVYVSALISQKPHVQFNQIFYACYMLPWLGPLRTAMQWFFAICYGLPVLWMTSCCHIMERMGQNQSRRAHASSSSPGGSTESEVCCLR